MLLALRAIHCEPSAVALGMLPPLFERVSKSHLDSGMWQLRQAILPASPMTPSWPSCGVPAWIGPESRGSKKSFWPRSAAAGESRYLLVASTGSAGRGESVLTMAHSSAEKGCGTLVVGWPECFWPRAGAAHRQASSPRLISALIGMAFLLPTKPIIAVQ